MDTTSIYDAISGRFHQHKYKLTNSYVFNWECDYFSVTQDEKYIYEVEVKVSRSDFFADFKKSNKHRFLSNASKTDKMTLHTQETTQHFKDGKISYCALKYINPKEFTPNRFYYCCPEGLIKKEEVPDYAGLLYLNAKVSSLREVKKAPLIHKNKNVEKYLRVLVDKFYFQFLNMQSEVKTARYNNKEFQRLQDENYRLSNIVNVAQNIGFIEEMERLRKESDKLFDENFKLKRIINEQTREISKIKNNI